jgi:hypothetical protein
MAERSLLITERSVDPGLREQYDVAWTALRAAASGVGFHAWRYRSGDRFIEFLEFRAGADPREFIQAHLGVLNQISPGTVDEWADAT